MLWSVLWGRLFQNAFKHYDYYNIMIIITLIALITFPGLFHPEKDCIRTRNIWPWLRKENGEFIWWMQCVYIWSVCIVILFLLFHRLAECSTSLAFIWLGYIRRLPRMSGLDCQCLADISILDYFFFFFLHDLERN